VAPSLELIEQLEKPLRRVAPFLSANTAKSGCSLMQIYRDTRFASDKTPYKTNIGIQFRHQVLANELIDTIVQRVRSAKPLMRFLCDAIGVPY
jgi:uncharacterized protein (DUF2461 family)